MSEFKRDLQYFRRLDARRLAQLDSAALRRFTRLYLYARQNFTGFWDSPPDRGTIQQKMAFILKASHTFK
jgi:hypothetical protein